MIGCLNVLFLLIKGLFEFSIGWNVLSCLVVFRLVYRFMFDSDDVDLFLFI